MPLVESPKVLPTSTEGPVGTMHVIVALHFRADGLERGIEMMIQTAANSTTRVTRTPSDQSLVQTVVARTQGKNTSQASSSSRIGRARIQAAMSSSRPAFIRTKKTTHIPVIQRNQGLDDAGGRRTSETELAADGLDMTAPFDETTGRPPSRTTRRPHLEHPSRHDPPHGPLAPLLWAKWARRDGSASGGGCWDDGDRAVGVVQDGLADRTDQHAGEPAAAAGAEDDQVGVRRQAQDVLGGMAGDPDQLGLVPAALVYGVAQFVLGHPVQLALGRLGSDDAYVESVPAGVVEPEVQRGFARRRTVVPDHDADAGRAAEVGSYDDHRAVGVGGQVEAGGAEQRADQQTESPTADDEELGVARRLAQDRGRVAALDLGLNGAGVGLTSDSQGLPHDVGGVSR